MSHLITALRRLLAVPDETEAETGLAELERLYGSSYLMGYVDAREDLARKVEQLLARLPSDLHVCEPTPRGFLFTRVSLEDAEARTDAEQCPQESPVLPFDAAETPDPER